MRFSIILLSFCLTLSVVYSFNFFPKYAQVFSGAPGSYFGYSVLLQAGTTNNAARLIVGSPKANSTNNLHSRIIEPGAVYTCLLDDIACRQFLLELNSNSKQYTSKRDNGWLGASIDGLDVANGKLVACAPRWINQIHKDIYYLQNGLCYLLDESNNSNVDKTARILLPLLSSVNQGLLRGKESVYYYALGEAGMSVHFAKNNTELLFGAPGVLQWKGTIGKYSNEAMQTLNVPNPLNNNDLKDFDYFGYSVSSGKFKKNETWYVGGAPRARKLFGAVFLFDYINRNDLKFHYTMQGQQEGEYFGAALTVGDVNDDGLDDVIIGSPMYSTANHYDVGLVYVYINNLERAGTFERTIINAPTPENGIRFGTAVSAIGDVNKDGYADVAIGAPYSENGQGTVYIYLGSRSGLSEQYSQKIIASEIAPNLKGFGSSFSRGVDVDNNNYNDIAIGSFLSSHAVILKSRPVVTIIAKLTSKHSQISVNTKSFPIAACLEYTGSHLPNTLKIKITINADDFYKRVYFRDNRGDMRIIVKEKTFKFNEVICEEYDILVANSQSDFTQPIVFKMSYELIEPQETGFCATCPVVDKKNADYTSLSIPFEIGCGEDNKCQPNLKLTAKFNYKKDFLVIGEEEKIDVSIKIDNLGHPAFMCKFYAEIPTVSGFVRMPDICETVKDNLLLCDMGNPFKQNESKSLTLPVDVSMLGSNDRLIIKLNVTSAGTETDASDNFIVLEMPLKTEVRISVIGISNPEQFNFIEQDKLKQDNLTFVHQYTVQNLGPSPLDDLQLIFLIPQSLSAEEDNVVQVYKPEVTADGTSMVCRTTSREGFYIDKTDSSVMIEAEEPTSPPKNNTNSHRLLRSVPDNISLSDSAIESATESASETESPTEEVEELNLPLDNPTVYQRVQKLIASDRELPEGLHENRTLSLVCGDNSAIQCMEVRCNSGQLRKNSRAVITFKLLANLTVLDQKREEKDTIVISSFVQPTSKYFKVNKTYTHTLLQGNMRVDYPFKWIILGLILGIILLCLIVYGLYVAGFFRRKEHEKLISEKDEVFGTEEQTLQTSNSG